MRWRAMRMVAVGEFRGVFVGPMAGVNAGIEARSGVSVMSGLVLFVRPVLAWGRRRGVVLCFLVRMPRPAGIGVG